MFFVTKKNGFDRRQKYPFWNRLDLSQIIFCRPLSYVQTLRSYQISACKWWKNIILFFFLLEKKNGFDHGKILWFWWRLNS
jgi:hypothetical protein